LGAKLPLSAGFLTPLEGGQTPLAAFYRAKQTARTEQLSSKNGESMEKPLKV
jgi:hypothetical protein